MDMKSKFFKKDGELFAGVMREPVYLANGGTCRIAFDANKPAVSAFHLQSSYDHGLGMFIAPVDRSGVLSWWYEAGFSHVDLTFIVFALPAHIGSFRYARQL